MKADYVHKDTRTIVVDGVEIQTSLTAVEIASLKQKNQKYKEVIDKLEKKIKLVKQYDFDRVGRYELLDILKEVE